MSYSVCLDCKGMVCSYEKFCQDCEGKYRFNDLNFWQSNGYDMLSEPKRTEELERCRSKEWDEIALGEPK